MLMRQFTSCEEQCKRLIKEDIVIPAYEYCLKGSHTFNLLDARGAISVTERTAYIARVRTMAKLCADAWLRQRDALGYPLLRQGGAR
jgi:glycyl-tRNA synthetase alpha chain